MIDNLINEIEQAMLNVLDNEQLSQLRKVLEYTFRNVSVTEKESVQTESNNKTLIDNFIAAKKVEGCSDKSISYYKSTINNAIFLDSLSKRHTVHTGGRAVNQATFVQFVENAENTTGTATLLHAVFLRVGRQFAKAGHLTAQGVNILHRKVGTGLLGYSQQVEHAISSDLAFIKALRVAMLRGSTLSSPSS